MTTIDKEVIYKAIDASGLLGSLYDGHRHCLIKGSTMISKSHLPKVTKPTYCRIEKGNVNLLELIEIRDDLRLNLLLNLTKRVGIASLMNYSRRIDSNTRSLYYSFVTRTEQLISSPEEIQRLHGLSDPQFRATHIVTSIDLGIDLIAILQLPNDHHHRHLDDLLEQIRQRLLNDNYKISFNEENLLSEILHVTIYSNSSFLTSISNLPDLLERLERIKVSGTSCHPISYYLRSSKWLNPQYVTTNVALKILPKDLNKQIEEHLLRLRNPIQYIEMSLKYHIPTSLYGYIQDQLSNIHQQWFVLKERYKKETKRISDIVVAVRRGRDDPQIIARQLFADREQILLRNDLDQLISNVHQFEESQQSKQSFNSREESNERENNDQMEITDDYFHDKSSQLILVKQYPSNNHSLSPIDHLSSVLEQQTIFSSNDDNEMKDSLFESSRDDDDDDERMNILLLGETGVGKSTFINALINYLSFDSLEQAQLNKPHVIIPVSFLMTIGDNFQEQLIQFGDHDNRHSNEDFEHCGQSVTQTCRSYLFDLNNGKKKKKKKICLIDTPGFGDTRGIDQDEKNFNEIFKYLEHFKSLHGICFLLKPNCSRLNLSFRLCFNQLIDFLGKDLSENLIFCFTNTRSTFYTPGDTLPLIKTMFSSLTINPNEQLRKDNTFCFDSEAFRYLIARQNQIEFTNLDQFEYETSWNRSLQESHRLIEFIEKKIPLNLFNNQWKSNKHAQFQIIHLIRPMLQTIRNLLLHHLTNNKQQERFEKKFLQLCPRILHRRAYLCFSCSPKITILNQIGFINEYPHEFNEQCLMCSCHQNQHIQIDYLIHYQLTNHSSSSLESNKDHLNILSNGCAIFNYFLQHILKYTKEDLVDIGFTRMIQEEIKICEHIQPNNFNYQLIDKLIQIKDQHNQLINQIQFNQIHLINLDYIYQWIKKINHIQIIKEQMNVIKKGEEIQMKEHQFYSNNI